MTDGLVEAVARARWERHYPAGRGSLAEKVNTPWDKVTGQSRREYLAEAAADIAATKASGFAVVPVEPSPAMIEAGADSYGDRFYFKPEHAARCFAAMIAAAGEG